MGLGGLLSASSRRARFWATAAVLVIVQALFILYSRRHDYFFLDDFLDFIVARTSGLNFAYLTHDVFGQFAPGFRLLDYLFIQIVGLHYVGVRLLDIVLIGATSVLILALARAWRAPLTLVAAIFAFLPFSPIFSVTLQWMSAAVHVLDGMTLGVAALVCLCPPRAIGPRRRILGLALWAVGLMFYAKLLFLPVLLVGVRMSIALEAGESTPIAIRSTWRDLWLFIPTGIVYLAIVKLGHYGSGLPPKGLAPVLAFIRLGFTDGFASNLLGLNPARHGMRFLACLLLLLPVIVSAVRRPATLLVWAGFFLQFALGMIAIAWSRVTLFGPESATGSRYHAETAAFYLICVLVTLVARPGREVEEGSAMRQQIGYTIALAIAAWLVTASLQAPLLYQPDDGQVASYITNFKTSLKTCSSGKIANATVPDWLMPDWMKPLNTTHDLAMLFHSDACVIDAPNAAHIDPTGRIAAR